MILECTQEFKKLQKDVQAADIALSNLKSQLEVESLKAENNVYTGDKDRALLYVEGRMVDAAESDCEGSYNCGDSEYEQEVIINDTKYLCTLSVEYNRHDKTYYYIEETDFQVVEI